MAATRIDFTQGSSRSFDIDLVDEDGEPIAVAQLENAVAEFFLREDPDSVINVLHYTTPDENHLTFIPYEASLRLKFSPGDTNPLTLGLYVFRVKVTLEDGSVYYPVDWSPFDLNLGGVAEPAQPVFDETTALNHNYGLDDALRYMTPGGSPIANAHVRVYYQADYVAGSLGSPVGTTTTKADGRWVYTLMVRPGFTYVVQFQKPNEYGPDIATVVA